MEDFRKRNRERLKELLARQPVATHAYFRRADDVLVDVPIGQVPFNITNNPGWFLDSLVEPSSLMRPELTPEPQILIPPKPSETKLPDSEPISQTSVQPEPLDPVKKKQLKKKSL